jgi:hypothetical protein
MRRIHYSGASLVTGDDIASCLVDYVRALAEAGASAQITLPVRLNDGGVGTATMLIGPTSQLVTVTESSPFEEFDSPELVSAWRDEIAALA